MSSQPDPPTSPMPDPTVDRASPAGWHAWVTRLTSTGRDRLLALGAALVVGFLLGALALLVFADLADEVAEGETLNVDAAVLAWLQQFQSPALDVMARVFSAMGSEVVGVLLVGLVGYFVVRRRWGAAASLIITTVGAQLLNDVLKDLFHRTRPAPVIGMIPAQSFSFPSGHAMVGASFYAFLAYLAWRILRGRPRWAVTLALALLVVLIGLSRLYLGVHYLTDVVAGYLAGFLWVDAVIIGGHLLARRRRKPEPDRPPVPDGTDARPASTVAHHELR